jgi:hypothetical protein
MDIMDIMDRIPRPCLDLSIPVGYHHRPLREKNRNHCDGVITGALQRCMLMKASEYLWTKETLLSRAPVT